MKRGVRLEVKVLLESHVLRRQRDALVQLVLQRDSHHSRQHYQRKNLKQPNAGRLRLFASRANLRLTSFLAKVEEVGRERGLGGLEGTTKSADSVSRM